MKIKLEITTKEQAEDLIKQLSEFVENEPVKRWEDLKKVIGYAIDENSRILSVNWHNSKERKNTFATEKQALSSLAAAQLSQLMKEVNGDWVADWVEDSVKYTLLRARNKIGADYCYNTYHFLAFPTEEIRDTFLKNHKELIEQYFEL